MTSERYDVLVLGGGIVGTWVAQEAARRGLSVGIVEAGPASLVDQQPPQPQITFAERVNLGATRARHHVLTGNSGYWGGGLCRNDGESLGAMFAIASAEEATTRFADDYDAIERSFGVTPAVDGVSPVFDGMDLAEIAVLPGKRRGVWSSFAAKVARGESAVRCHVTCEIQGLDVDSRGAVEAVRIVTREGAQQRLAARAFVLSMGVIDSSIFALKHLRGVIPEPGATYVGNHLHDHWSVPLARIRWKNGTKFASLFPPKFARGAIVGRRACSREGFLHLTADFDAMPPYDRVKQLLGARQRNEPLSKQLRLALETVGRPFLMARAGIHYLSSRELFVPDGSEITLTLDFESVAALENHIRVGSSGRADLHWDLRAADHDTFARFVRARRAAICSALQRAELGVEWLAGSGAEETTSYLERHAIDAYHLGGGLQVAGPSKDGVVNDDLTICGTTNLFVLGTSTFRIPGLANPVLTLLAQARALVNSRFQRTVQS